MKEDFKNPIPYNARSIIYLIGLVVASASIFVPSLLLNTQFEAWIPTVTALFGLTGAVTAVLAKANLSPDDDKDTGEKEPVTTIVAVEEDLSPSEYRARIEELTSLLQQEQAEADALELEGYDASPVQYETRRARREAEGN